MSDMSNLAKNLWSRLNTLIAPSNNCEAAQAIVELFQEAGCDDLHECLLLMDAARVSILDDEFTLGEYELEETDRDYDCFHGGHEVD